jgi:hypothetical protein
VAWPEEGSPLVRKLRNIGDSIIVYYNK